MTSKILKVLVPLTILTAGALIVFSILRLSPPPAEATEGEQQLVVEVQQLTRRTARPVIIGTGEVTAAEQVVVSPEVTARVVSRHESLIPGGRLEQGDVIARLDGRAYRLALRQQEAQVQTSRLEVETEQGRQRIAQQEWELLGDDRSQEEASLALRRPHFEAAQASLSSSEAGVDRARLDLSRTTLRAPFNAVVVQASADPGQLVSPTSQVAILVGTDELWVEVSIPTNRLPDVDIPGVNAEEGATARVIHDLGGRHIEREGRVLRLASQLDTETRTATLLVAVQNPFDEPEGAIPLLPGAFVTVEIDGRESAEVLTVPNAAVYEGTNVWVMNNENRLQRRSFETLWGTSSELFVTSDELDTGDRVIVSPLSNPVEGTRARTISSNSTTDEEVTDERG